MKLLPDSGNMLKLAGGCLLADACCRSFSSDMILMMNISSFFIQKMMV